MLGLAILACSGIDDVIGQRQVRPTPTLPPFATATPGGRISVMLDLPGGDASGAGRATPVGQLVAPAATATALSATVQAATATAAATPQIPLFTLSECPAIAAPPPPARPASFIQYPETIGRYLSAGGPTTLLESLLRSWGAIQEGAVVQADTDLSGDGVPEVIVTLYDPGLYQPGQPSPGVLLVYGCAQGGYRLFYSTVYGPGTIIPELRRVGDMNGDVRAELAYSQRTCQAGRCTQTMHILSWSATLGAFSPLNDAPMNATSGRVTIADLDGDGVLEVAIAFNPGLDMSAGPQRRTTDIWDWDGESYRLAVIEAEAPIYRIHAVHDADMLLEQGEWRAAIRMYDRVRDDPALLPWTAPNEALVLRAYAGYRKVLASIGLGRPADANAARDALLAENPPGMPGEVYAALARTFLESYARQRNTARACTAVLSAANARPDALITLNSYGYANRVYTFEDLCPFR